MNGLGLAEDGELVLAVNRLKSLQKLYLFEQKGGENYLGWESIIKYLYLYSNKKLFKIIIKIK